MKIPIMRYFTYFLYIFLFILSSCEVKEKENTNAKSEISTFYFIRHAEKDRSDKTNRNPELTEAGHKRSQKWSDVFKNISFDVVYSTDYNRTQQTAKPTAEKNNLDITSYDPRNLDGKAFILNNTGKTVLVVGHSNTTPAFVNAVIGEQKYEDIDDSNNANLYTVTIINNVIESTILKID